MRAHLLIGIVALSSHPFVSIMQIQGRGHTSPLAGDTVVTTGVVTVVAPDGLYIQDPVGDDDPATSDGLFAFTADAPIVATGDLVRLEGVVNEYRPGNDAYNLTVTELSRPIVTVLSRDNARLEPVLLGHDGRQPPTAVIDDDSLSRFDPFTDGIDFYESIESMLVRVPNAVAVSATNRYGELWVVPDAGLFATGTNARGGVTISPGDFNPERIQIDDTLLPVATPVVEVGDVIGDVSGVVGYRYGNFELLPLSTPEPERQHPRRETASFHAGPTDLTIASFNAENLDRRDDERVAALADIVVTYLGSPDIVVIEEVQDDSGVSNDGTVTAESTYTAVVASVKAAGGPDYEFRDIAPEDGMDGGAPGANIRVGILFRPGRVTFVDRGLASASDATDVLYTPLGPTLSLSPGRIEPQADAWRDARKPLAAELIFAERRLFLVACHFSSRSGSSPLFGAVQPPVVGRSEKRITQAGIVRRFVDRLLALDPEARVVVLGDFNDFQFSQTLRTLSGSLVDLTENLPASERYTYNFEGNSQALDHILVSRALATRTRYDVVHVCVDFADAVSDHDPVLGRLAFGPSVGATSPAPLVVRPNPFASTIEVLWPTKGGGLVVAEIYDVAGRCVRILGPSSPSDGAYAQTWDGLDDRGHPVPSGVYVVRVTTPQGVYSAKIVRVQ